MSKQRTNAIKSMTLGQSASIEINAPVRSINLMHRQVFETQISSRVCHINKTHR